MLTSLRQWRHLWRTRRATLKVRSDSISALVMVLNLKATGRGPSIIARELALDLADALYRPVVAEHVPGVANVTADGLSRMAQDGTVPSGLTEATRVVVPERTTQWWRTLAAPKFDSVAYKSRT